MLFPFQFVKHAVNRIGEIPCYFLDQSIKKDRYSSLLFPTWFRPVIKKLPALELLFIEVFNETKKLKKIKLKELQKLYTDLINGYDIGSLCENIKLDPPKSRDISDDLHEKLKKLYSYFFSETLKDSKNLFKAIKGNFDQQYIEFRDKNLVLGKVCPMCGIHEYPLRSNEPKAQYDHWLPEDIYPLLAINFFNLVPICGFCNNIKSNADLLFEGSKRSISFYPYKSHFGLNFNISSYLPLDKLSKADQIKYTYGKYEWIVKALDPVDEPKIISWNRVFNINNRYASYSSDYYYEIKLTLKEYLAEKGLKFNNGAPKEDLVKALNLFGIHRIKDLPRESGSHLKRAFLQFISIDGNESLLYTLFDITSI